MNIADLRRVVQEAASDLEHPWKRYDVGAAPRLSGKTHPYGRLVYSEDGAVGGLFDGQYLIARGTTSDESIWALAEHLGLTDWGPPVGVTEVDAGWFWLFANPGGRTPEGQ
ncbi:MAG TPA: hypothetical protein VNC22_23150 [Sporichthya sp.]|jgi:hypothetical protein|nr:hypothetical protein [Sporichthya sp.]